MKSRLEEIEVLLKDTYSDLKVYVWDEKESEFRDVLSRWTKLVIEKAKLMNI